VTPIKVQWPKCCMGEKRRKVALIEVLNSGYVPINGPKEIEFNKRFAEYTEVKDAICHRKWLPLTCNCLEKP